MRCSSTCATQPAADACGQQVARLPGLRHFIDQSFDAIGLSSMPRTAEGRQRGEKTPIQILG